MHIVWGKAEVLEVLEVCPDVYLEKWMLLLDFTRSSEFWDEKVFIGAPICNINDKGLVSVIIDGRYPNQTYVMFRRMSE